MSRSVCVLVRIAVLVPQPSATDGDEAELPICPIDGHACFRPKSNEPIAVGITAEMMAFYREHPDSN